MNEPSRPAPSAPDNFSLSARSYGALCSRPGSTRCLSSWDIRVRLVTLGRGPRASRAEPATAVECESGSLPDEVVIAVVVKDGDVVLMRERRQQNVHRRPAIAAYVRQVAMRGRRQRLGFRRRSPGVVAPAARRGSPRGRSRCARSSLPRAGRGRQATIPPLCSWSAISARRFVGRAGCVSRAHAELSISGPAATHPAQPTRRTWSAASTSTAAHPRGIRSARRARSAAASSRSLRALQSLSGPTSALLLSPEAVA
jgi:hypothetical protein